MTPTEEIKEDEFNERLVSFKARCSDKHCAGIGCPSIEHDGHHDWFCRAFNTYLKSKDKWIIQRCPECIKREVK